MIPSPRIDLSIDTKTLHGYVKRKDVDELRKFISNKNDLMLDGLKGKKGLSALHVATIENNIECARVLLDSGANINIKDQFQARPIHYAASLGRIDILKLLIDYNANLIEEDGLKRTPIDCAVRYNQTECTETILKHINFDINAKNNTGSTLLHLAAEGGSAQLIELLLRYGANVNSLNDLFCIPLHIAALAGNNDVLIPLLEAGSDIHTSELKSRETPLHKAAVGGNQQTIEILLEYKADKHSLDINRRSPLHLASLSGNMEAVTTLIDNGSSTTLKDKFGKLPRDYCPNATTRMAFNSNNKEKKSNVIDLKKQKSDLPVIIKSVMEIERENQRDLLHFNNVLLAITKASKDSHKVYESIYQQYESLLDLQDSDSQNEKIIHKIKQKIEFDSHNLYITIAEIVQQLSSTQRMMENCLFNVKNNRENNYDYWNSESENTDGCLTDRYMEDNVFNNINNNINNQKNNSNKYARKDSKNNLISKINKIRLSTIEGKSKNDEGNPDSGRSRSETLPVAPSLKKKKNTTSKSFSNVGIASKSLTSKDFKKSKRSKSNSFSQAHDMSLNLNPIPQNNIVNDTNVNSSREKKDSGRKSNTVNNSDVKISEEKSPPQKRKKLKKSKGNTSDNEKKSKTPRSNSTTHSDSEKLSCKASQESSPLDESKDGKKKKILFEESEDERQSIKKGKSDDSYISPIADKRIMIDPRIVVHNPTLSRGESKEDIKSKLQRKDSNPSSPSSKITSNHEELSKMNLPLKKSHSDSNTIEIDHYDANNNKDKKKSQKKKNKNQIGNTEKIEVINIKEEIEDIEIDKNNIEKKIENNNKEDKKEEINIIQDQKQIQDLDKKNDKDPSISSQDVKKVSITDDSNATVDSVTIDDVTKKAIIRDQAEESADPRVKSKSDGQFIHNVARSYNSESGNNENNIQKLRKKENSLVFTKKYQLKKRKFSTSEVNLNDYNFALDVDFGMNKRSKQKPMAKN